MTPMIWVAILLVLLVFEFIRMELLGACGAVGALAGLVANIFGLAIYWQIGIAVAISGFLIVVARPVGMKYVNRIKKESANQLLIGADAIVVCDIDNAHGVGVVSINGKQWSARSHRANSVIRAGEVVKVVAMNKNTAIVDDRKRGTR